MQVNTLADGEKPDEIWENFTIETERFRSKRFMRHQLQDKNYKNISWEMFLVIRFLGNVSYATMGQMNRFLVAWKKYIQPDITLNNKAIGDIISRSLIVRVPQAIKFNKGKLKDKKLFVYHLTRKAAILLGNYEATVKDAEEIEYIRFLQTREPKGENFYRLKHEILIAEAYLQIFERGNYVYTLTHERQMRSKILKAHNFRSWTGAAYQELGELTDFEISYYDRDERRIVDRRGEVAVKYSAKQIESKQQANWWICYDEREAEKIENLTTQKPEILGEELYKEATKKTVRNTGQQIENLELYRRKAESLGAVTIKLAMLLWKKSERSIIDKLKQLEAEGVLTKYRLSLVPGESKGRGYSIYVTKRFQELGKSERCAFVKIQALLQLAEDGYEICDERKLLVMEKQSKKVFTVIGDNALGFGYTEKRQNLESYQQIIQKNEMTQLSTMIAVRTFDAEHFYKYHLPNIRIINITKSDTI